MGRSAHTALVWKVWDRALGAVVQLSVHLQVHLNQQRHTSSAATLTSVSLRFRHTLCRCRLQMKLSKSAVSPCFYSPTRFFLHFDSGTWQ